LSKENNRRKKWNIMPNIDLFKPFSIGKLELRNRFVRSATWDNTADSRGFVTDLSVARYEALGKGEIGLIINAFAYVSPPGQALPGQYGVHNNDMIPGLSRLTRAVHDGGGKIALQLVHAGLNSPYLARRGITSLAVSQRNDISEPHREMTGEEIEGIIDDFAGAAVRAREAGFDAVQLHGAHGYLMSQFLSPIYNLRTDRWGGNAENSRRFHLELVKRVRKAIGEGFPFLVKLGIKDDDEGGLTLSEGIETAQRMIAAGIDAVEVSGGVGRINAVPGKNDPEPVPYRERAGDLRRAVDVPVMVVLGIRSIQTAQSIVDSGDADLISMSRPFIREPGLIARWRQGDRAPAKCISCGKCDVWNDEPIQCREKGYLKDRVANLS
jgi:2,4-dienoyl-CoA reductase-like NADH-dependent reductase (Old Yellow Enzyme family)